MTNNATHERRRLAAITRVDAKGITGQARYAAIRQAEEEIEREELTAAAARQKEQSAAEQAKAERQRVASCIEAGRATGRARQLARIALSSPLDAAGAKALVASLPPDAAAQAEALRIPTAAATFGTAEAQAERTRMAQILGAEVAADRFAAAAAFALETPLGVADALAALALVPAAAAASRIPTIAERAAEMAEFGGSDAAFTSRIDGKPDVDAMWKKAVHEANISIGAVDPTPRPAAGPGAPSPTGAEHLARQHSRHNF
ncbi:hypothetical protein GQF56_08540 [Rhodobacter sphaeroides]|jgi:hypothetical protein|uniref:Uncharacterized protein n=2 Tax=Cereibacter sphaeroides TaxID=1063 RepID=Q3J2S2_CERS4|nr:hypothetical protein [Cereibacter sphaeroides]ABA78912.1 hypothetical protein RSP_6069 [Cereibacter sphaeroides 2.4.1]AXC62826.1 hypothetical protein DQL45_06995 [Cereibacter sphaeroides 2.4.1]MVX47917.1 hypothetical protein [Cereibacter sphaeroides]GEM93359.1 hypothetical protein RSP03_24260 [Cereibacter sphaeroides]